MYNPIPNAFERRPKAEEFAAMYRRPEIYGAAAEDADAVIRRTQPNALLILAQSVPVDKIPATQVKAEVARIHLERNVWEEVNYTEDERFRGSPVTPVFVFYHG